MLSAKLKVISAHGYAGNQATPHQISLKKYTHGMTFSQKMLIVEVVHHTLLQFILNSQLKNKRSHRYLKHNKFMYIYIHEMSSILPLSAKML